MDFYTCVNECVKGNVVIEDVLVDHSFDGTSVHVTLCGPYGVELTDGFVDTCEFNHLKSTLKDSNFLTDF